MDMETIWKVAVIGGLVTLNFKLVYAGINNYKNRKNNKYNGNERRTVRYTDECLATHAKIDTKIEKIDDCVSEIQGDVQYIRGKLDGG